MSGKPDWQAVAQEEIEFFGSISASISHEINNRLAVINEKAGLLEDMAIMMAKGRPVDPERIGIESRKIVAQIRDAKEIVNKLNRFAHSVDAPWRSVDVGEMLAAAAELYARKASMRNATLAVQPGEPVVLVTNPFLLTALIGRGIELALATLGESRTVSIAAETAPGGICIRFAGTVDLTEPTAALEDRQGLQALLTSFGASFRSSPGGTALVLEINDGKGSCRPCAEAKGGHHER